MSRCRLLSKTSVAFFGLRVKRVSEKTGIEVLGVRYHSVALAEWNLKREREEVMVRWHQKDIGAISVNLSGRWTDITAVHKDLDSISAQSWLTAVRLHRAAFPRQTEAEMNSNLDGVKAIDTRVADAKLTRNLLVEDWTDARIEREQTRLLICFRLRDNALFDGNPDETSNPGRPLPQTRAEIEAVEVGAAGNLGGWAFDDE